MQKYFVICLSPDGTGVSCLSKGELEERLAEDYWGENPEFLDFADGRLDLEHSNGLLIIKGERIEPKPVDIVKSWSV